MLGTQEKSGSRDNAAQLLLFAVLSLHFSLDSEQGQRNEPLDLFRLSAHGPSGAYHQSFSTLQDEAVNDAYELLVNIPTSALFFQLGLDYEKVSLLNLLTLPLRKRINRIE
jgi:hypothetical protein